MNKENGTFSDDRVVPGTRATGYYSVPTSGRHFLEILILLCEGFDYRTNFASVCLEDPHDNHNALTGKEASIDINNTFTSDGRGRVKQEQGFWRFDKNSEGQQQQQQQPPIYTRIQPKGCMRQRRPRPWCIVADAGLQLLEQYHMTWRDGVGGGFSSSLPLSSHLSGQQSLLKNQRDLTGEEEEGNHWVTQVQQSANSTTERPLRLCSVGASHARELVVHMSKITGLSVSHGEAKYPHEVVRVANKLLGPAGNTSSDSKCDKIVVGMGQWDAGWPGGAPTLFPAFEGEIEKMVNGLLQIEQIKQGHSQLFIRSLHYNPLGERISSCPPGDWRSPPVIDQYNVILKRVAAKFGIEFIDTNFVIGPMWDRAGDWCHFRGDAGRQDAMYIAARMMGLIESN